MMIGALMRKKLKMSHNPKYRLKRVIQEGEAEGVNQVKLRKNKPKIRMSG